MAGDGWNESAGAWLQEQGAEGDFGRRCVLDRPMLERVTRRPYGRALDVGCGEGRFCRMLGELGITTVGIDPTHALLEEARLRDPGGDYRAGRAEALEFEAGTFDLVVSYLSLIDIPDLKSATQEMVRVLTPGGTLLIANLTSFNTAGSPQGWRTAANGERTFQIDNYLEERGEWAVWRDMRVLNWHRPLSAYMQQFLSVGLNLTWFDEPEPYGGDPERVRHWRRVPYFLIMEWTKPA